MNVQKPWQAAFFQGIAESFNRNRMKADATGDERPGFDSAAHELGHCLETLRAKLEARKLEQKQREAITSGRVDAIGDKLDQARIKAARMAEVHARIRHDVLQTHARLGTGIDDVQLGALHRFMVEMKQMAANAPGQPIDARIRGAVVRRLFEETGEASWELLLKLMQRAAVKWPSVDERSQSTELAEAAALFLGAGLPWTMNMVVGVVEVWKDHYPDPSTRLWQSVCLHAVAAGLRARLLQQMVTAITAQEADIRSEGDRLIAAEVEAVQRVLEAGIDSIERADTVLSGASELLERVIPELCLDRVRHLLTMDGAHDETGVPARAPASP